jgi:hypothetical protein
VDDPLHTYGAQLGLPWVPAVATEQVPLALPPAAMEHASQLAEQAELQQKLSTQKPVAQVAPEPQALPFPALHSPVPSQAELPWHTFGAVVSWVPADKGAQLPAPFTLHAWHDGQVDEPQQTPSTQLALLHWLAALQDWPLLSLPVHTPAVQKLPEEQSPSLTQLVLHELPPQMYGAQVVMPLSVHEPLPSQVSWFV